MAQGAESQEIGWYRPEMRGQISIDKMHISKSLIKAALRNDFTVKIDTAFGDVMRGCADREETWINSVIAELFEELHQAGFAHSVEVWDRDDLVGGLYGLAIGGVFCGESMFSRESNVSKIALVHLVARLWRGGFTVLDTQYLNDHLLQFGAYEIPDAEYQGLLYGAIGAEADFTLSGQDEGDIVRDYLMMRELL